MDFLQLKHPTFKKVWVRVVVVIFCTSWALGEIWLGNLGWGAGIGGLAAFCAYKFATIDYSTLDEGD